MKLQAILAGVEAALNRAWPDVPVYHDRKPKDFVRPSFLLEGGPLTFSEVGGHQAKYSAQIRIVVFTPIDAYGNSQAAELRETVDSLVELFEGGYIQIQDRAPHVEEATADYGFDYAEATAKLSYYERRQHVDASMDSPLMENFQSTIKE